MEVDQDCFEDYNLNRLFADLETPVLDFLPPLKVEDQGRLDSDMSFDLSLVHDDFLPPSTKLEEPSNVAGQDFQKNAVPLDYLQRLKDFCQKEQEREESVVRKQFLQPDQLKDESQPAAELQEISDKDQRVQLFDLILRSSKSMEENQDSFEEYNRNTLFADLENPVLDDFHHLLTRRYQGGFDSDMSFDLSLVHDDVLPSSIKLEEPSNVACQDQPSVVNSIGLEPLHQDLDQADYSHHQVQADTTYIPQFGNQGNDGDLSSTICPEQL